MNVLPLRTTFLLMLAGLLVFVGLASVASADSHPNVIVFNTPVGADAPGPLLPGNSYSATFSAERGEVLSFATMLVQSNDWFFSPNEWGISLYDGAGNPRTGDVTRFVHLLDAGTEVDQVPGEGADQAPRQSGPDTGAADANNSVRYVRGGAVPPVNQLIKATLSYANSQFTLNIENVSGNSAFATPLAPGIVILHVDSAPLFDIGQADRNQGLEALAEDGNPAGLAGALGNGAAPAAPSAPASDSTASDGAANASGAFAFAVPDGGDGPAPLFPGESYSFSVEANLGESLHLATMLVQSNDWFFAPNEWGIPLYNSAGSPNSGDMTGYVHLWDAGTEEDEKPGEGANQAPRQSGPNVGPADDNNLVRRAHDPYGITPAVKDLIHVSVEYRSGTTFDVVITNVSGGSFASPLAPGAATVTNVTAPMFQTNNKDRGLGLEALAEDGSPVELVGNLP